MAVVRVLTAITVLVASVVLVRFAPVAQAGPLDGPTVDHVPVLTHGVGEPVDIAASSTCPAASTCELSLAFRTTGGGTNETGAWQRKAMTTGQQSTTATGAVKTDWAGEIPGGFVDSTGVDYYLELVSADSTVTSPTNVLGLLGVDSGSGATHYHVTAVAPPVLHHAPTLFTPANKPLTITAHSTCSVAVCNARLFYKTTPNSSVSDAGLVLNIDPAWTTSGVAGWTSVAMTQTATTSLPAFGSDRTYASEIPASAITTAGLDYFILVTDGTTTSAWPGTTYQAVTATDGVRTGFVHVHVLETSHIVHVPVLTSPYRADIAINATANCPATVTCSGRLYFRTTTANVTATTASDFESVDLALTARQPAGMGSEDTATFVGSIPARVVDTRGVDYFFSITDGTTTSWYPGTSQVDGYLLSVDGVRVGYSHIRVVDPPHIVPTTAPVTNAGVATEVSILASCATASCDASLYYAQKPVKSILNAPQADFVEVPMTPTGTPTNTSLGVVRTYKATIPAADVTTRGLLWSAKVDDGYVTTYSPGVPYIGAYLAAGGTRITAPDTGLVSALRGVLDPTLLNTGAGLADLDADGWSLAPVLSNLALGDKVDELLGATAGELNVAHAIRVLEPPHVVHVPELVAPRAVPLDITAKSNCSVVGATPKCRGVLTFQQADGSWESEPMAATAPTTAGGLWTFTSAVPADAMSVNVAHYRIRVTDGTVSDTTPTIAVTTQGALAAGVVSGRAWIDRTPDPAFEADDLPVAEGTVVRALLAGLDLTYGTADDVVVATAKTDAEGRFYLRGLVPAVTYGIRLAANPAGAVPASTTTVTAQAATAQVTGVNLVLRALDSDSDNLYDILETFAGLNPNGGADNDHDGLSDYAEVLNYLGSLDPTKADTDGDGIRDDVDDVDGDGLTNLTESNGATNPLEADEDHDELNDAQELSHHSTYSDDDTDDETLPDGFEVNAGTDPTKADTDGDGIRDDAETLTSTVTGTNATVELTGTGALATGLTIVKPDPSAAPSIEGLVGPVRDITLDDDLLDGFDTAKITLPYPDTITDPSDLGIFYYNEDLQIWVPASATFARDSANHTVSVTVDHFTLYAVVRISTWATNLNTQTTANPAMSGLAALDTAIVVDTSYSMEGPRLDLAKAAATDYVTNTIDDLDQTGLIEFWNGTATRAVLGTPRQALQDSIASLTPGSGTNIYAGVSAGLDMLAADGRGDHEVLLLLTDGEGSFDQAALSARALAEGVRICTVSVGTAPTAELTQMAQATGCGAFDLNSVADIPDITAAGAGSNARGTDTDQDGLPDLVENADLTWPGGTQHGATVNGHVATSPTNPDTDHDELGDGEEVHFTALALNQPVLSDLYAVLTGYYIAHSLGDTPPPIAYVLTSDSDPTKTDTDGDGLTDLQEFDRTDAWYADGDYDGLSDPRELEEATNPEAADTDGDGLQDGWEVQRADEGFDPRVIDERVSKWTWLLQLGCGIGPGQWVPACDSGSVAYLVGDITSSLLMYGDFRNIAYGLFHIDSWSDVLWLGGDLINIAPVLGDIVGNGLKIGKFVVKGGSKVTDVEARAAVDLAQDDLDELYDATKAAFPDDVNELEDQYTLSQRNVTDIQLSNKSLRRLREDLDRDIVQYGTKRYDWLVASGGKKNWQIGEDIIRRDFGPDPIPTNLKVPGLGKRRPDAYHAATKTNHESKVGAQSLTTRLKKELAKDCFLIRTGEFSGAVWHFLPGKTPGGRYRFGASGPLLDYIESLKAGGCNVSLVYHLPTK